MRETGLIGVVWGFGGGGGGDSGLGDVSCSLLIPTLKGILVAYCQLTLIIFVLVILLWVGGGGSNVFGINM